MTGGAEAIDQMAREIAEGPDAVVATLTTCAPIRAAFDAALASRRRLVVVATGASLAMSRAAASAWRVRLRAGIDLVVRHSTEAALGGVDGWSFLPSDLIVAVSQSGTSPETVSAASQAREAGATVVAITAHPETSLAEQASMIIPLASGEERDASTKSAVATLAALLALAGALPLAEDDIRRLGQRLQAVASDDSPVRPAARILADARRTWLLGFGSALGIAEAGQLLWHEKVIRSATTATPSEFRHGLVEAFGGEDAVVLIDVDAPEPRRGAYLGRLRDELRALGGTLIDVAPGPATTSPAVPPYRIALGAGDTAGALEATLRLQQLADATALAAGTYRDGFAVLRHTVLPAHDLFD